jgi:hypothetical protein
MIVDVIDMEDPVLGEHRNRRLDERGATSERLLYYGMSNGVGQMVADIKRLAATGSIEILRIWGHGRSGGQSMSGGHGGEAARRAHWTGFSVANIEELRPQLSELRPLFGRGSRAELRGCSVAAGNDGETLLRRLAEIWGTRVQGGTVNQISSWTGPVHEAQPDGSMRCVLGIDPPP